MRVNFGKNVAFKTIYSAIALTLVGYGVPAFAGPQHVALVGDLHSSSPARNQNSRESVLRELNRRITNHKLGNLDYVTVQTAGDASRTRHIDSKWNRTVKLRHGGARAKHVPDFIADRINDIVKQPTHDSSDLIWALNELSTKLDCTTQDTTVYVVSDVVSGGAVVDGYWEYQGFSGTPFTGCKEIVFLGLGTQYAGNPNVVKAAETLMRTTMSAAGFQKVSFR